MKCINDIIESVNENSHVNYFVFGEGGIGKTTQLRCLYLSALNDKRNIIPFYLSVKDLPASEGENIFISSVKEYCGNDVDVQELKNLLDGSSSLRKNWAFLFIIDGYNEAVDTVKKNLRDAIFDLSKFNKNIFVISSRTDDDAEIHFPKFKKLKVKPLDTSKVLKILGSKAGLINKSLLNVLVVPIYLKYFLASYKKLRNSQIEKLIRKSDILDSYLQVTIDNCKGSTTGNSWTDVEFTVNYYLPALAFEMHQRGFVSCDNKTINKIRKAIDSSEYYERFNLPIRKIDKYLSAKPYNIAVENLSIFQESDNSFIHQIWQEYFCAKYYVNCLQNDVSDVFSSTIGVETKGFIGEILKDENNKCEADFASKKDLTTSPSPIESYLQMHNLNSEEPLDAVQTANLIEIMKTCRHNHITADYSHLDLTKCVFTSSQYKASKFCYSKILYSNFIPDGHTGWINSSVITSDNKIVITVGRDAYMRFWDIYTGLQAREPLLAHNDSIIGIAISSDGKRIATGSSDKTIRIWHFDSDSSVSLESTMYSKTDCITCLSFAQNNILVSADGSGYIRIWDLSTFKESSPPINAHKGWINALCINKDCSEIISGGDDNIIRVWNIKTQKQIGKDLKGHTDWVSSVAMYGVNEIVSTGDSTIRFWNIATSEICCKTIKLVDTQAATVAVAKNAKTIVVSCGDGTIRKFECYGDEFKVSIIKAHNDWVNTLKLSDDDKTLVSSSWDKSIRILNLDNETLNVDPILGASENIMLVGNDGKYLFGEDSKKMLFLWNMENKLRIERKKNFFKSKLSMISASETNYAYTDENNIIYVFDQKGKCVFVSDEPVIAKVNKVVFSSQKSLAISCHDDGNITIWDTLSKHRKVVIKGHDGAVNDIVLLVNSPTLISCGNDKKVKFWDMDSLSEKYNPLVEHTDWVNSVQFFKDEKMFITAGYDQLVKLWTFPEMKKVAELNLYTTEFKSTDESRTREWSKEMGVRIKSQSFGSIDWKVTASVTRNDEVYIGYRNGIVKYDKELLKELDRFETLIPNDITNADFSNIYSDMDVDRKTTFRKILSQNGAKAN